MFTIVINTYTKFLVFLFFGFIFFANTGVAYSALKITSVNHPSNYRLSKNPENLTQLVDSRTHRHPLWTKEGALGWVNRTPLSFGLLLNDIDFEMRCSGSVSVHTGKNTNAGVNVPRRIDIYIKEKRGSRYLYSSGKKLKAENYQNKKSHWIRLNDIALGRDMVIVIHGKGRYIMLDEISTSINKCNAPKGNKVANNFIDDPVENSLERLKKSFRINRLKLDLQGGVGEIFVTQIYNNISDYTAQNSLSNTQPVKILGYRGEKESRIISLKNYTEKNIKVRISSPPQGGGPGYEVYKIERVLAANGEEVYDPLIPLSKNSILLKANSDNLFFVKFDLKNIFNGDYELNITSNAETSIANIKFDISVVDIGRSQVPLNINVWSYRHSRLFNIDEDKSIGIMQECGVNVFIVHTSLLPKIQKNSIFSDSKKTLLIEELKFYKDKGLILLFANWNKAKTEGRTKGKVNKKLISNWLLQIKDIMSELGISNDEWALYPVDEPTGPELVYLYELAKTIKEIDKNIQIYANPISTHTNPSSYTQLDRLTRLIDYWQPGFNYIKASGIDYFSSLDSNWWIYENPPSPAKSSGGLFYRKIAWSAWSVNAKGFGFWSFSDTGKSSSWDDFDGSRPDYAVIYEHEDTIIKSLRWESFCDGVEDFKLLNITKFGRQQKAKVLNKIKKDKFIYSDIEIYRKRALDAYSVTKAKKLQ